MKELPYSPHDLLPIKRPFDETPNNTFFYSNVVKHLIPDILRIMQNGVPMDVQRIGQLKEDVEAIIADNKDTLKRNKLIKNYLEVKKEEMVGKKAKEQTGKFKKAEDFDIKFKIKTTDHRTKLVNMYLLDNGLEEYVLDSWSIKDLNKLHSMGVVKSNFISNVLVCCKTDDTLLIQREVEKCKKLMAEQKAAVYNKSRLKPLEDYKESLGDLEFNLNSPVQKNELFELYDIDTLNYTPTGSRQIDRDELNRLSTELNILAEDEDCVPEVEEMLEIVEVMIDNSNAAIINNNFIPAFHEYVIDGLLYGNLVLFGTKTFRLTSNKPNLLNLPSSGNRFAKAVKECLIAPEGFVIYAADLNALEDRVGANLTGDTNKCDTFLKDLDSHCLNSMYYVPDKIEALLPRLEGETTNDYCVRYKEATETNKDLKQIRQDHKPVTFGLSYGCGPKKIATVLGISLEEAEEIYNNYHYKLYPGITHYRENIVLPRAEEDGRIHLGLGCYMYSEDVKAQARTLFNACSQFWSILTLLAINKIHHMIDAAGLQDDIKIISSIYDSIYFVVKEDAKTIKWLNDNIIPLLTKDFLEDQLVPNEAEGEIGYDWYSLNSISNNASLDEIQTVLDKIKE